VAEHEEIEDDRYARAFAATRAKLVRQYDTHIAGIAARTIDDEIQPLEQYLAGPLTTFRNNWFAS
jgi:hypothetical protein